MILKVMSEIKLQHICRFKFLTYFSLHGVPQMGDLRRVGVIVLLHGLGQFVLQIFIGSVLQKVATDSNNEFEYEYCYQKA